MKIIFVQQAFHNNHRNWVDGLLQNGWTVRMYLQKENNGTQNIPVDKIPVSRFYTLFSGRVINRSRNDFFDWEYSFPPLSKVLTYFKEEDPDFVVVKRYKPFSLIAAIVCEYLNIPTIFYDQYPVYGEESFPRRYFRQSYSFLSKGQYIRISPVSGDIDNNSRIPNSHYVPFSKEVGPERETDSYLENGIIRVIAVGDLRQKRKRLMLLLKAIKKLNSEYPIKATIIGSVKPHRGSLDPDRLTQYVDNHGLSEVVTIMQNVPHGKMEELYRSHDLFVLPSKDEPAAYSLLEAMAQGLPVICSDSNGTRCYIDEGSNGYIFETDVLEDLHGKIETIVSEPDSIPRMGTHSQEIVRTQHQPKNLFDFISSLNI